MENQDVKRSMKVGAFVLGGVLIFLAVLFYLGREGNMFNKTFTVSAVFKNVEGLSEGDNVWLSGVKIGTVKSVQIISDGQVIVTLSLKDKQNEFIKKDATAYVGSDGLVGNKIVVIRPGTTARIINDYDTINALSPTDTQELFNIAKDVGVNARSISDDLKSISARLNKGEGIFGELLREGPVAQDIRQTISSLKATGENTNKMAAEVNKIVRQVNHGDGLITKLLSDTLYPQTFDSTLHSVAEVGANAKKMSKDLEGIIAKMNNHNNAVGVLLTDTAFAEKMKATLTHAKLASIKLNENMEALQHNFLFRGYFRRQERAEKKKIARQKNK